MALLDRIRQKIRRCTGLPCADGGGKFTAEGQRVVTEMSSWAWCSIFFKVNLVGLLGVSLLMGMKLTYVFFSWLNETLAAANLGFPLLCVMILGVALLMFLCPIVPGRCFGCSVAVDGLSGLPTWSRIWRAGLLGLQDDRVHPTVFHGIWHGQVRKSAAVCWCGQGAH